MNQVNSSSEKSSTFFGGSKLFNTKTLLIIGCCYAWGIFFPLTQLLLPNDFWGYQKYEYDQLTFSKKCYMKALYYTVAFTADIYQEFAPKNKYSKWICFFIGQFIVYTIIGTAITLAAYPPWRKTNHLEGEAPIKP